MRVACSIRADALIAWTIDGMGRRIGCILPPGFARQQRMQKPIERTANVTPRQIRTTHVLVTPAGPLELQEARAKVSA